MNAFFMRIVRRGLGLAFISIAGTAGANDSLALDTWHIRNAVPQVDTFYGITRGNGNFVTVGSSGTIFTSPDGVAWTRQTSAFFRGLEDIAYGAGLFVAGGDLQIQPDGSRFGILTSPDGVVWSRNTNVLGFNGITYGGALFVALSGRMHSSSNGFAWTQNTNGLVANDVVFGKGIFVAVGGNRIHRSTNGAQTWTSLTVTGDYRAVTYGNGLFVTVGNDGKILVSGDGTNWTAQLSGTIQHLRGITFSEGIFVAVGLGGTLLTSSDAVTWTHRNTGITAELYDAAYGNGTFVAVGSGGTVLQSDPLVTYLLRTLAPENVGVPPRPTYSLPPPKQSQKDSLVIVTHGWIPRFTLATVPPSESVVEWVDEMADLIRGTLEQRSADNWQVASHKWVRKAWTPFPGKALENAVFEGKVLGKTLDEQGWQHIHFISHSAGAALVETASRMLDSEVIVHLTFLDAYAPSSDWRVQYGAGADWADSYSSRDTFTDDTTEGPLPNAHNVDVTWLDTNKVRIPKYRSADSETAEPCYETATSHEWAHVFYLNTISSSTFGEGYGFPLGRETGNWNDIILRYPKGRAPVILGQGDPPCEPDVFSSPHVPNPNQRFPAIPWLKSASGSVQVEETSLSISIVESPPQLRSPQGENEGSTNEFGLPAWVAFAVSVSNAVNVINFEARFVSTNAAGLLSVYWNTNLLGVLDEQTVSAGLQRYTWLLPAIASNGTYVLGFRIDRFSTEDTGILITNVSTGAFGPMLPISINITSAGPNRTNMLTLEGPSGFPYQAEASTNLVNWRLIAYLVNTNGHINFIDSNATNFMGRFYRALWRF